MRVRESDQLKNSMGTVRTRNQSRLIEAELSEVEDHGEEIYFRSNDQDTKFQSQKRKS